MTIAEPLYLGITVSEDGDRVQVDTEQGCQLVVVLSPTTKFVLRDLRPAVSAASETRPDRVAEAWLRAMLGCSDVFAKASIKDLFDSLRANGYDVREAM